MTLASQHADTVAFHLEQSLDCAEYDEDEATEYGETHFAKWLGVGLDTGALEEELNHATGGAVADLEPLPAGVDVVFTDGSRFRWAV